MATMSKSIKSQLCLFIIFSVLSVNQANNYVSKEFSERDIFDISNMECKYLQQSYSELNSYLIARTNSDDPRPNFDIALEGLILDLKNRRMNSSDAKRIFLSLSIIGDSFKCNSLSSTILWSNNCADGYKIGAAENFEPSSRVDKILVPIMFKHAIDCQEVYKERYDRVKAEIDRDTLDKIDNLFKPIMEKYIYMNGEPDLSTSNVERLYNTLFDQRFSDTLKIDYSYLTEQFKRITSSESVTGSILVKDETNGKKLVNKEKFEYYYNKFILKPCREYAQIVELEIFRPADQDSSFKPIMNGDDEDYYRAWVNYRLCSGVLSGQNKLQTYINLTIELADSGTADFHWRA